MKNNRVVNVAVLIDVYSQYGGASKVAFRYASVIREYGYNSFVICNNTLPGEILPDSVFELNSIEKCKGFIIQKEIDAIHYFKAAKGLLKHSIFKTVIEAAKHTHKDIRVLTTVCQQPSYGRDILTPYEISNSDHILFIDKTAYYDSMFRFIPEERKSWMYLTLSKEMLKASKMDCFAKQKYDIKDNTVVFGRGSTLNKCPKDTIELYDRIKVPRKKKFVVVGIPEGPNWFSNRIKRRGGEDIVTFPMQLPNDYYEIISHFDIILYYLPQTSYSSRDGSLRDAMRLGIPVVVYGPSVIKEAVTNGVDGYVAETKDEFVEYSEMLANDKELRERIGKNARRLYFENAPDVYWAKSYTQILDKLLQNPKPPIIQCPFFNTIIIYIIRDASWLASVIRKGCGAVKKLFYR